MKKALVFLLIVVAGVSCSKVPITHRRQLNLLPESYMQSTALTSYQSFLTENKVVQGTGNTLLVQRVGKNIADAAERFLKENGGKDRISGFKWEYNLVQSDEVNAWCMPGGKIVVYTGILPYTKNEYGLATVIGHEVSHAIARHGNERMSQQILAQAGGVALDVYLSQHPRESNAIFQQVYGVGTTVGVLLPFSRMQESEADKMGLIIMAMAGYDPNEAIGFWERMAQASSGAQKPPFFLSTHPSDEQRIADLKKWLPEAMKYYKKP